MTSGRAAEERPGARPSVSSPGHRWARLVEGHVWPRPAWAALGVVVVVGALVPPLSTEARRLEALEALQFALLAMVGPALLVLGAPWRVLGLSAPATGGADSEGVAVLERPRVADLVAAGRRRHPEQARSLGFLALDTVVVVVWRLPVTVDALARHGWLSVVEALTLVGAGGGLWLELIGSPPFAPRLARPKRIALAAVAMWTIWVTAYLVGLAHAPVYRAYAHVPGGALSVWADQAITTGVLWLTALCAFLPVIFSNLVLWLRSDEDADEALYRLVRDDRRRTGEGAG